MAEIEREPKYEGFRPEHPFKGINLGLLIMVPLLWAIKLTTGAPLAFDSVLLGFVTGIALCCYAFNVTGGRTPESWRRKLPSR